MTAFDISISIELNLDTLTLSFIEPKKIYEKKIKQKYFFWGGRGGGVMVVLLYNNNGKT